MMHEVTANIGLAMLFALFGGTIGIVLVLVSSYFLPGIVNRLTPNVDEEKEIIRGNVAVAEYFGRVVSAGILGVSVVAAAAVLGGIIAALH